MRYLLFEVILTTEAQVQLDALHDPIKTLIRAEIARLAYRQSGSHLGGELRGLISLHVDGHRVIYKIYREHNEVRVSFVGKRTNELYDGPLGRS